MASLKATRWKVGGALAALLALLQLFDLIDNVVLKYPPFGEAKVRLDYRHWTDSNKEEVNRLVSFLDQEAPRYVQLALVMERALKKEDEEDPLQAYLNLFPEEHVTYYVGAAVRARCGSQPCPKSVILREGNFGATLVDGFFVHAAALAILKNKWYTDNVVDEGGRVRLRGCFLSTGKVGTQGVRLLVFPFKLRPAPPERCAS